MLFRSAYLRPLLAQDGTIPQLRAIVRGNKKPAFIAMDAKSVFKDAPVDVEALTRVLQLACDEAEEDQDDKAEDEDETAEEKAAREKKEKDDADAKKAEDADEDEDEDDAKAKAKEDDKKANDAAIKLASDAARAGALSEFRAIRQAEQDVQPLVGAVVAMDSAEAVYRFALDSVGVENKGVHASALPALISMVKERQNTKPARVAMDASAADDFAKRYPNATKLVRA